MGMITLSVTARRGIAAASLTAAAALVAACGSSGGSQTAPQQSASSSATGQGPAANGSGTPNAGPASAASPSSGRSASGQGGGSGLTACMTSSLNVAVDTSQGGGAAGSTYLPIDFANSSGRACSMEGFPGVSFVTGPGGSQIGAAAARNTGFPSVPVTLAAHASAHAWLQVAEAGNYPPSTCHMVTAAWLRVFPPGNTLAAYVRHTFSACSSAKVNLLTVMPVRSGAGARSRVP
jgi:Protein of unknown function (DUF4232)